MTSTGLNSTINANIRMDKKKTHQHPDLILKITKYLILFVN